ncbi:MAG: UDP-N-acetylmuramate--L-alanine ligase [Candidatus Omnitrophica bacterium CG11_big_fil_rev_8_21_14_0_20_63_9]|nr:MAG: UDP-N-acetylmuramate--L-alanine ligase [Candidatus Omnitrophica bacterium CG11_big_fil_rev_8_21_14_0_20_63_9]
MSGPTLPIVGAGTRLHFMGIGGIGMSGLASICAERGAAVSGCDTKLNAQARRLQRRGISVSAGHHAEHLQQPLDLLVYSSAVDAAEAELSHARSSGLRVLSRGELLAALASDKHLIGVAGAHGKTTTSGMASQLLVHAGWEPTVVVGGVMLSLGNNARFGRGAYLVAETDESDGSFLHLFPRVAIVTNIDREHLNHYHTFERLIQAFEQFVEQIRPGGTLIRCFDDPLIRQLLTRPSQISYGFEPGADVTVDQMMVEGHGSRFRAVYKGRLLGHFTLQVPGRHNVLNALAVVALGITLELPLITIQEALAAFQGTRRRFQVLRLPGDIWFVEDYAHHPSEIRATLAADAVSGRHRLVVFQPHRFSRTQSLEREFSLCFDRADGVIVTDIYPAFEAPIPGVSGERLAQLIRAQGHPCVRYVPKQELPSFVHHMARAGDTVFFLGAGDIGEVCHDLATRLHAPA